jgi:hypothetical protein
MPSIFHHACIHAEHTHHLYLSVYNHHHHHHPSTCRESSDDESGTDDEESEEKKKQSVPEWARGTKLREALELQYGES